MEQPFDEIKWNKSNWRLVIAAVCVSKIVSKKETVNRTNSKNRNSFICIYVFICVWLWYGFVCVSRIRLFKLLPKFSVLWWAEQWRFSYLNDNNFYLFGMFLALHFFLSFVLFSSGIIPARLTLSYSFEIESDFRYFHSQRVSFDFSVWFLFFWLHHRERERVCTTESHA